MSAPKVSVVIPTFNRSAFLKHAITSVLGQTYSDFEIIISDNASTDDTAAIIATFPDRRIKYFRNDRNVGMGPNWNIGVQRAKGLYVVLLEDDNWWHPEYLARAAGTLDQHLDVAFVHTAVYLTDAHGNVIRIFRRWTGDRICSKRAELIDLIQGNKIFLSSVTVRRSVIESIGMFDDAIPYAPDWDLWLRIYTYYDGAYVAEPLLFYRQHEANVTREYLARPAVMFEDHRYTVEKALRRIGEVYGVTFARQIRKLSSRWLIRGRADMEFWRAWETYLSGEFELARQEAGLALQCDPSVVRRFPLQLFLIALSKYRSRSFGRSIATIEGRLGRWLARNLPSVFRLLL